MKTIAHILFNLKLGGTESMLLDIMSQQVSMGFRVILILINDVHDSVLLNQIDKRVEVKYINKKEGSKSIWRLLKLNLLLHNLHADAIHVHNVRALGMLFGLKNKITFTAHCLGIASPYIKRANKICAISNAVKEDVKALHGLEATVVYNGIDVNTIKAKQGLKHSEDFKIVQVGRMYKETKGQDILINALARLRQLGVSDICVDFIGDGASMAEMKSLVERLDLTKCVNFLGAKSRNEIYKTLSEYDLLVQPSRDEGFGLTLAEAMAAKIPVLTSDLAGPMEVIDGGRYGSVFELGNDDVENCANKILEIKNNYQKYFVQASSLAYNYVVKNFDIKNVVINYQHIYFNCK